MRNKIVNISSVLVILFIGIFIFNACDKDEEVYERTRLFSPVLNEDLYSINNTIIVNMGKMKEASSYTIEISRDSFLTIDYSIDVNENLVTINAELVGEELLWFTMYQIRATAHANDANYDSKASDLGSVRTQKFPSNMTEPTFFDVLDTRAKVYWTPQGADITNVKVFALSDARLTSPLLEFELTPDEILANLKIVSGLTASTGYQIAIYSSGILRGWEVYTTREAMVSGDNVVNLTGIDSTVNLADVLPDVADGSIVLLEGGKTYDAGGYKFDKSIAFQSGYSFVPALPVISCGSNFNMADGSNIDYITFKDIEITADGGFGGKYAFNIDKGGSIGEIKFESCKIRTLRGIARVKGGVGTLEKYTILNCVIDSIQGYGILTMDKNTWMVNDILIKIQLSQKLKCLLLAVTIPIR